MQLASGLVSGYGDDWLCNNLELTILRLYQLHYPDLIKIADLVPSEVEAAKKYPPHTALCVRNGWAFCFPEAAAGRA